MDIYCHRSVKDERDATRTSRMGLETIKTLTDELRMRYGRAMDAKVCMDFILFFNFFRNVLGILSDLWHVTTDHSMPLWISQAHWGCYGQPYGWKR